MKEGKRFISIFMAATMSLLLSIAIFNYSMDPLSVFSESANKSSEYKLAKLLTEHANIISTNMDERKFIKARVNLEPVEFNPNIIIVGSSRVMQIGNHILNKNIFNLGVSGATIEDEVAILDIATKKFNPNILSIGVDPWIFNEASGQTRWQTLSKEYEQALSNLDIDSNDKNITKKKNYEQLIGYAYTKESFSYFYKKFISRNKNEIIEYIDSDQPLADKDIIRRDGSRVYNLKYATQNEDLIIRDSKTWINYSMESYYYSDKREEIFEAILEKYNQHYEIILFKTPYHPSAYKAFIENYSILLEIENKLKSIAKEKNVRIIGSYNPDDVGCLGSEFYDGAHPKDVCLKKIITLENLNHN
jgi:hypothetical protein